MDYIRNSKNRKLKTQILNFFSRLAFGGKRLDISGRSIVIWNFLLFSSVFFPWIRIESLSHETTSIYAFSLYTGGLGYGLVFGCMTILFFLLSHEKKERIRAYVPFRLSDAQAIVFVAAMITTACIHLIFISLQYTSLIPNKVTMGIGFSIALSCSFLILISAFFFSRSEKVAGVSLSYLDKKDLEHLGEYEDILDTHRSLRKEKDKEKNMTLPI